MDIDPQETQQKNGVNGQERSPTPPPHRSNSDAGEADSFKLAGNKFFKDGNYARAIEEYNKGMASPLSSPSLPRHVQTRKRKTDRSFIFFGLP